MPKRKLKTTPQQKRKDEAAAYARKTVQDVYSKATAPTLCDCLQDEICAACRRASGDGPLVMCQTDKATATNNQFSIVCAGCDGKKVQYRQADGINILCPVCNGSGQMPPVPVRQFVPWPLEQPYPWHQGTGVTPPVPFPGQIID